MHFQDSRTYKIVIKLLFLNFVQLFSLFLMQYFQWTLKKIVGKEKFTLILPNSKYLLNLCSTAVKDRALQINDVLLVREQSAQMAGGSPRKSVDHRGQVRSVDGKGSDTGGWIMVAVTYARIIFSIFQHVLHLFSPWIYASYIAGIYSRRTTGDQKVCRILLTGTSHWPSSNPTIAFKKHSTGAAAYYGVLGIGLGQQIQGSRTYWTD